ncbi:MAG: hypothetical protein JJU05_19485 [Verrucomicrobia bacterium]|nr:hypothetical protein [Verrucomicrobiota bacterium]
MSEYKRIIEGASLKCSTLKRLYPKLPVVDSISSQIQYLNDFIDGKRVDPKRLDDIIIGVQTAREIEAIDMDAADLFYQVDQVANELKNQKVN